MIQQLNRIDDRIPYQIGDISIVLQWVADGAYTVTTTKGGILRIEDNCGSYPTEDEARAVARGYAQMYQAEADAETIHLRREPNPIACGATGPVRVTRTFSEVTCQPCIDAEDRRLGRHDDIVEQRATRDAYRQPHRATPTRTRVHTKPPTPAEKHLIRNHVDGVVKVRPGQPWTMLRAIHQRIGGQRTYRPGTHIIASLTLNDEQIGQVA